MPVNEKHPLYTTTSPDWEVMRDTYAGERRIKGRGVTYLPPTSGHLADGMQAPEAPGRKAYDAYRVRARFPDYVQDAVAALIGMMHHKPPVIELPASMEPLLENATTDGEGLEDLLRRVNTEQLLAGRVGLLADLPEGESTATLPYIATYMAESMINWDGGGSSFDSMQNLRLVVLDEGEHVRRGDFKWDWVQRYRVLALGDPTGLDPAAAEVYSMGVFEGDAPEFNPDAMLTPTIRGKALDHIPFVFANATDLLPDPLCPPLLGLSNLSLAIYRGEADYRQSLFLQGQDTLVIIGAPSSEDAATRVGSGAVLEVPVGGDAKFIGVESTGLSEQRVALENDRMEASNKAGQLVDVKSREKESGESLHIRVAAQTATLNRVALTGAAALERLLKSIARWTGVDPEAVKVEANLDFADEGVDPKAWVDLMAAKSMGLPLSSRSIHKQLQDRDLTEMEFEEELAEMESEGPELGGKEPPEDEPEDEPEGGGGGA